MTLEQNSEAITDQLSVQEMREDMYERFGISWPGKLAIEFIFPLLEIPVNSTERYNISARTEILAEIALYQAYSEEPKFKLFLNLGALIAIYDILHPLPPQVYGILFVAVATINGLSTSLRSPQMIAAELDSETDTNGMRADLRAKAINSANTNVTIVLLSIAVAIQILISSSVFQSELLDQNYATGTLLEPISTVAILSVLLYLKGKISVFDVLRTLR